MPMVEWRPTLRFSVIVARLGKVISLSRHYYGWIWDVVSPELETLWLSFIQAELEPPRWRLFNFVSLWLNWRCHRGWIEDTLIRHHCGWITKVIEAKLETLRLSFTMTILERSSLPNWGLSDLALSWSKRRGHCRWNWRLSNLALPCSNWRCCHNRI